MCSTKRRLACEVLATEHGDILCLASRSVKFVISVTILPKAKLFGTRQVG